MNYRKCNIYNVLQISIFVKDKMDCTVNLNISLKCCILRGNKLLSHRALQLLCHKVVKRTDIE